MSPRIFSPQHIGNTSTKKTLKSRSNKPQNDFLEDKMKLPKPKDIPPRRQFRCDFVFDDLGLFGAEQFQNQHKYQKKYVQRSFEQKQKNKKSFTQQIINTFDHHTTQNSLVLKQLKQQNLHFTNAIENYSNKLMMKLDEKEQSHTQTKRQIKQISEFLLPKLQNQKDKMQKQQKQFEKKIQQLDILIKYQQQQSEYKSQQQKKLDEIIQKITQDYNNVYKKNQLVCKRIKQLQFQNAVNRVQIYHGFYRFGLNYYFKPQDRKLHFDNNYVNWLDKKTKCISLIDLRCFILSCLYPMSSVIFDSVPTQSKLYYSMFDVKGVLTEDQHKQHLNLIQEIFKKFLTQRKTTIHSYLKKSSNIRKKDYFSYERKAFIKSELLFFNNQLIKVRQVDQIQQQLHQNIFCQSKLLLRYDYSNIQLSIVLQLYHLKFVDVKKKFFIQMAKQNNMRDSNFIWMEIPKYFLKQYYQEVNGVYQMLKKIDNLSFISEKC